MKKIKVLKDITIFDKFLFKEGDTFVIDKIIQISRDGVNFELTLENILIDDRFKEIPNDYNFKISEINDKDDQTPQDWRMVLDIKTTKSKLKQIEFSFRKILDDIL